MFQSISKHQKWGLIYYPFREACFNLFLNKWNIRQFSSFLDGFKVSKQVKQLNLLDTETKCMPWVCAVFYAIYVLRVISDWPFKEPVESLLPKFGLVANGAKRKLTFDIMDVTCKHSETLAPFFLSYHLEMIIKEFKRNTPLKVLGIAGKQNLAACHTFHAM